MLSMLAGLTLFGSGISAQDLPQDLSASPDDDTETVTPISVDGVEIDVGRVDVLQVSGFFDPILVNEIESAIDRADKEESQALILQVNSDGTVVSDAVIEDLMEQVATAPIPIG
ncbi:MAG: hypothetical protein KUG57_11780, partial [Ilumatobacteraceae bacterium]|nr:hypothetical protein [Ilumatobacteraceae bacterium]